MLLARLRGLDAAKRRLCGCLNFGVCEGTTFCATDNTALGAVYPTVRSSENATVHAHVLGSVWDTESRSALCSTVIQISVSVIQMSPGRLQRAMVLRNTLVAISLCMIPPSELSHSKGSRPLQGFASTTHNVQRATPCMCICTGATNPPLPTLCKARTRNKVWYGYVEVL